MRDLYLIATIPGRVWSALSRDLRQWFLPVWKGREKQRVRYRVIACLLAERAASGVQGAWPRQLVGDLSQLSVGCPETSRDGLLRAPPPGSWQTLAVGRQPRAHQLGRLTLGLLGRVLLLAVGLGKPLRLSNRRRPGQNKLFEPCTTAEREATSCLKGSV